VKVKAFATPIYQDRAEAGRQLAVHLAEYSGRKDVILLALPRGGVPVAYEAARQLQVPLDIFLVRKLGLPGQEELAMGAIASGGVRVLNKSVVRALDVPDHVIQAVTEKERNELERRERLYRGDRPPLDVRGKVAVLIDDGLATGSTMLAAVESLRHESPAKIVVAVPVAALEACQRLKQEADEVICPHTPHPFMGVGAWYNDFSQTSDDEVRALLGQA
jgi:predicted phosphoribosyltransferase